MGTGLPRSSAERVAPLSRLLHTSRGVSAVRPPRDFILPAAFANRGRDERIVGLRRAVLVVPPHALLKQDAQRTGQSLIRYGETAVSTRRTVWANRMSGTSTHITVSSRVTMPLDSGVTLRTR